MIIPTEQLLNIPGIRVLSVRVEAHSIHCEIESTQGYSMCHRCGQKAMEFHGYDKVKKSSQYECTGWEAYLSWLMDSGISP